jgi:hypothetical protein
VTPDQRALLGTFPVRVAPGQAEGPLGGEDAGDETPPLPQAPGWKLAGHVSPTAHRALGSGR